MIKALRLAMALALIGSGAMAQTTVDLTLDQARDVATQALFADDPQLAIQIAEAILSQVPDDRASLLIVAAAAPRLGDPERGRKAGARAFAVSTTDFQKYEAARLTALAAANEERYTLSTFWLRRALTVAPNAEERARTLNDARGVTRLNPWSSNLSFSLAPSNNVNGGAEDKNHIVNNVDTNLNISDSDLALAGWRATLGLGTQYRFQESAKSRSIVGLSYQGVRGTFREDTELPDETLRTDALTATLRHDRVLESGALSIILSRATFQYRTYSSRDVVQVESYETTGIRLERNLPLSDKTSLSLLIGQERLDFSVGDDRIDRTTLGAGLTYELMNRDRVNLALRFVDANGDNARNTSRDQTLSISYNWAEPIGPVSLSVGAGATIRIFPSFIELTNVGITAVDGGRKDSTAFANLSIGFPQMSYAGFSPGLRLDASRTRSNVSRYDRTTLTAGLTISSSF